MELTIEQALQQGVAAQKQGNLQEAERLYRAILKAQPTHPDANHNLGVIAVFVNKAELALPLFKTALEADIKVEKFWLSYIEALINENDFETAKAVLQQARRIELIGDKIDALEAQLKQILQPARAKSPEKKKRLTFKEKRKKIASSKQKKKQAKSESETSVSPPQTQLNALLEHYQNGQHDEAEKLAMLMTKQFPKNYFGWKVLGSIHGAAGRTSEAINANQKTVALSPHDAEAHNNLGNVLQKMNRLKEAEASYGRAIALKPDFDIAYSNLGATLHKSGRLEEAEANFRQAILLNPDFAETHNNLGGTLQELGRLEEAEASCRQAIAMKPDYAEAQNNLGNALKDLGKLEEAETSYTQAIAMKPQYAEAINNLGVTFQAQGRLEEAEASYTQAIAMKPDYAEAHRHLTLMKKFNSKDEQFSRIQELYIDKNISREQLCHVNFSLAKIFEDFGDFEQSFKHYSEGNMLRKKFLNYNVSQDIELFSQLKTSYPRIAKSALEAENFTNKPIPIFIVGMPRSGTTLVEQIISSHTQVTGAGELSLVAQYGDSIARGLSQVNTDVLLYFREKYITELQNRSNGNPIATDKMPHNFLYIGLLSAAFPEAKIVHVKRNSAAVCWANYKQYFTSKNMSYCFELDDVIKYYGLYKNLMEYWEKSLADSLYYIDYELLTANQEHETRQLINYLGLDWEEKCLSPQDNMRNVATASNMQVRQAVYQGSSQHWKKFKPFLNDALDYLDD